MKVADFIGHPSLNSTVVNGERVFGMHSMTGVDGKGIKLFRIANQRIGVLTKILTVAELCWYCAGHKCVLDLKIFEIRKVANAIWNGTTEIVIEQVQSF